MIRPHGFRLCDLQDFAVLRAMHNATEVQPVVGDICELEAWAELQDRWRL
jgi:hypothetical protein